MQQQRKNIDIGMQNDEVHNNPNLHSEEQDELEIPDSKDLYRCILKTLLQLNFSYY
ncbi:hypothetical protein RhiirB3_410260, partial [Rhizophagus irregularis]